jgi:hypothetical protein
MNMFKLKYHDVSEGDLLKAIVNPLIETRQAAINHPNVTRRVLLKGIEDKDPDLRFICKIKLH